MRQMLALIPSVLFLLGYAGMQGLRDGELAKKQMKANHLSFEMNALSAEVSRSIQSISVGNRSYDEVQLEIADANERLAAIRRDLEATWSEMDELKVKAAHDEALARILKFAGMGLSVLAFAIIGTREPRVAPHCLVSIALMLGLSVV